MKYKLVRAVSSSPGSIDLDHGEFDAICAAKRNQLVVTQIEEKFDLFLGNYAEFEETLLKLALHMMVYGNLDNQIGPAHFQLVNRRLGNLLSAARLFLDQLDHDTAKLEIRHTTIQSTLNDERARQYDSRFGYRALEALRNFTQHRGLPVHNLSYPMRGDDDGTNKLRSFSVEVFVDPARLAEEGGLKKAVLDELLAVGAPVALVPLVRDYVEGIAAVHEKFRALCDAEVREWEQLLETTVKRAEAHFDHIMGLAVVEEAADEEGVWPRVEQIHDYLWMRRRGLRARNAYLRGLAGRYVSSRQGTRERSS